MITLKGGYTATDPRLGRVPQLDERSRGYDVADVLPSTTLRSKSWACRIYLDQGQTPACVGNSRAYDLAAAPATQRQPTGTLIDEAFAQSLYKLAQQNDEWPGECVDMETSCLSKRGWISGDELEIGDEILTFDIEREGLEWSSVERVHRYPVRPYRLWGHNQIQIAATDNHRWLVRNSLTEGGYSLIPTAALKAQHIMPRCAPLLDQPSSPVYDDDEVELVAWAITEGYFRPLGQGRGHAIVISQKSHRSRVTALMERLGVARGYEKSDGCHAWEVSGGLAIAVREAADASVAWLARLTKRQLRIFVDACVLADGTVTEGEKWGRLDRRTFMQKPGKTLDMFLAACALAGIATTRSGSPREYTRLDGSTGIMEAWSLRRSSEAQIKKMSPSPYLVGPVWCPQTANGTFVARRDGCVFITGNSYEGSSVLGGLKAAVAMGYSGEYRWAFNLDDWLASISHIGGSVVGTTWLNSMFHPRPSGLLEVDKSSGEAGGHAYYFRRIIATVEGQREFLGNNEKLRDEPLLVLRNSWGALWGKRGEAAIWPSDYQDNLWDGGEQSVVTTPLKR